MLDERIICIFVLHFVPATQHPFVPTTQQVADVLTRNVVTTIRAASEQVEQDRYLCTNLRGTVVKYRRVSTGRLSEV